MAEPIAFARPLHHLALGTTICSDSEPTNSAELRRRNGSWRVDESYVRVAGKWTYLYRAVDFEGNTIHFMLSPYRDLTAAKYFLQLALWQTGQIRRSAHAGSTSTGTPGTHARSPT
jgi:transposase-like protein